MQRTTRAWIMLPAIIVAITVVGLLVSSFQKEAGIAAPNNGGVAAVAAAVETRDLSLGAGADDFRAFSRALRAALVARKNAPLINPADTRLDRLLVGALDCLTAAREAWQAEIEHRWDPDTHGAPDYWSALHPVVDIASEGPLTPGEVRLMCSTQATEILDKAIDLVD